jgi:small subunit ribosomal protein S6
VSQYEITYILSPGLEEPKVAEVAAHFSDVAKNNGAESIGVEHLGKRRLAYEIKRQREGYYVVMQFSGPADAAKEVVRQLRLHDDVLRALLVRP